MITSSCFTKPLAQATASSRIPQQAEPEGTPVRRSAPADRPQLLYIWGHAYEFDIRNDWDAFDRFLAGIAGREDVCYCTNIEAFGV